MKINWLLFNANLFNTNPLLGPNLADTFFLMKLQTFYLRFLFLLFTVVLTKSSQQLSALTFWAVLKFPPPNQLLFISVFCKVSRHGQNEDKFPPGYNTHDIQSSCQSSPCSQLKPPDSNLYHPLSYQHSDFLTSDQNLVSRLAYSSLEFLLSASPKLSKFFLQTSYKSL